MSARRYVVGGGTGALGRVVVRELLAAGAQVAVPYRAAPRWQELQADCDRSPLLWGAEADAEDNEAMQRFFDKAASWAGGLDGAAALAGAYAGSGPFETAPADEWTRMLGANLETARALCRAALPHLLPAGGSVVTVAAQLAETGGAGAAAYAVSKAGVVALTRSLALENKERGVRFNCIVPSVIDTHANREAMPKADRSRWTGPQAIARVVAFLLSSDSAAVSGAVIPVQGRA